MVVTAKNMKRLLIANVKGFQGKSFLTAICLEWAAHKSIPVYLSDSDDSTDSKDYVAEAKAHGRVLVGKENEAELEIIDTTGAPDDLAAFVSSVDLLLIPMILDGQVLKRCGPWLANMSSTFSKIAIMPNKLKKIPQRGGTWIMSLEERDVLENLQQFFVRGVTRLCSLPEQHSMVAGLLQNGSKENFFTTSAAMCFEDFGSWPKRKQERIEKALKRAQVEIGECAQSIFSKLELS